MLETNTQTGFFKYLVWFVATLFVVYAFCLNTASSVFSEAIKSSLHASNLGVSLASGSFILGYACMQIPAGYLLDTCNARFVVSGGMMFAGLGIGTPLLGWLSNRTQSRTMVLHVSLTLGTMALLLNLYLPHFDINTLIFTKITAFLTGFFLSGSMLFYTIVSEISSNGTRGVAISVLNSAVYLFNAFMLFIPYVFITASSVQFFTYLWVLPFFILFSILLLYFIKDSYTATTTQGK